MDAETLKAAGFVEATYPGQDGTFLSKRLKISSMPYASAHIVDDWNVWADDVAVVELTPGGDVQMCVLDRDYMEDPVPVDTEEGRALLRDAGVVC